MTELTASPIKIGKDGGRIQFDVPTVELHKIQKLYNLMETCLKVTIEVETYSQPELQEYSVMLEEIERQEKYEKRITGTDGKK